MTAWCSFCLADLDEDGQRTCTCRPVSRLADVAVTAARACSRDESPTSFRDAFRDAALVFRPRPNRKDRPS